jgi:phosphatidylinositol alpha-mannosyltransferase
MRIGLVCPYNLVKGGGVQEGVLALQHELAKRGHHVKILTPLPRDIDTNEWPDVIFIGTAADIKSPFATTAQVSVSLKLDEIDKILSEEKFDILHFHEPWVPMMSRQILSKSSSTNIATFHAHLPDSLVSKTVEAVVTPYTKPLLKSFSALTAVSTAAAEYTESITKAEITIIPNGINLAKYQVPRNNNSDTKTILYIGRLEKRKGVKFLISAFALLEDAGSDVRLVLAGDGPDRDKLERQVMDLGLKNVEFRGFVDEAEKLSLLSESDLFCSPALYGESFGIVLLEAMAAGLPVVAGDNPGYKSVLQGRGKLSLVNPKDSEELARRMNIFLDDSDIKKLWCEWASEYVKQFDYPNVVNQYVALYKKALKS